MAHKYRRSCGSEECYFAMIAVGRPEEEGCYCQLNTMLREAF